MSVNTTDFFLSFHERNTCINNWLKISKTSPDDLQDIIGDIVGDFDKMRSDFEQAKAGQNSQNQSHFQNFSIALSLTQAKVKKLQQRYSLFQRQPILPPVFDVPESKINVQKTMTPEQQIEALAKTQGFIFFYDDATDPLTGCFGNFHICPKLIHFDEGVYSNSEAIFQSRKFTDQPQVFALFTQTTDGAAAVKLGQSSMSPIRHAEWDSETPHINKIDVMMNALRAKFGQNPTLKAKLMATGSVWLVEHLPSPRRDTFWSDAFDGSGENMLGYCLMKLREEYGGTGVVPKVTNYLSVIQSLTAPTYPLQKPCIQCHQKPQNVDLITGRVHDFCSIACANLSQSASSPRSLVGLCTYCGARPKSVDTTTGRVHEYCGRTCLKLAQGH